MSNDWLQTSETGDRGQTHGGGSGTAVLVEVKPSRPKVSAQQLEGLNNPELRANRINRRVETIEKKHSGGRKYAAVRAATKDKPVQLSDGTVYPPRTADDKAYFVKTHPGLARALGYNIKVIKAR